MLYHYIAYTLLWHSISAWSCKTDLGGHHYDFTPLDEEYLIEEKHSTPPSITYTTYRLNPCSALREKKNDKEEDRCHENTQVCKTTRIEKDDISTITEVLAFATLDNEHDAEVFEDKESSSRGIRLRLYEEKKKDGEGERSTVIDFVCDSSKTHETPKLVVEQEGLLKIRWHTKIACGKTEDGDRPSEPAPDNRTSRWGFFTWFFMIVFMTIAAFLIFTLFLNYNRYGQVGLDFIPAMDSVKDIPYLFKDFASQVSETFKGSQGRSGYSAV